MITEILLKIDNIIANPYIWIEPLIILFLLTILIKK